MKVYAVIPVHCPYWSESLVVSCGLCLCECLLSLLIDVNHAECGSFVGFALVFDGEDHDLVAGEAVGLLLGHFENERDQLLHVLLYREEGKKQKCE